MPQDKHSQLRAVQTEARNQVESSGVMVSIIVVNTSLLNISHLTHEPLGLGTHSPSLLGKEIRVTGEKKNSFVEGKRRNLLFGALKLEPKQTVKNFRELRPLEAHEGTCVCAGGGAGFAFGLLKAD